MSLAIYAGLFADDLDVVATNLDLGARVASADGVRTAPLTVTSTAMLTSSVQVRRGGAGGARTHDRRIMSPLL